MTRIGIVVVGASRGGLDALSALLAALPEELDAPVVVAQHRSPAAPRGELERILGSHTARPIVEVSDKEPLRPRRVYVAPPDYHLLVEPGLLTFSTEERVLFARPSIDVLFESAAEAYHERAVGIVLTGANEDGAEGLARIKQAGGVALVQDPETAEARTMPAAALAATEVDAVLPVDELGAFLRALVASAA